MNKICTSIEQSKKLIELGIDVNTADMWWAERYKGRTTMDFQYIVDEEPYYYLSFIKPSNDNYSQDTIKDIPAWSLAALLNIIPQEIFNGEYVINITEGCDENWVITYDHIDNKSHSFYGLSTGADNLIDVCYEMILKLNEQKLL